MHVKDPTAVKKKKMAKYLLKIPPTSQINGESCLSKTSKQQAFKFTNCPSGAYDNQERKQTAKTLTAANNQETGMISKAGQHDSGAASFTG